MNKKMFTKNYQLITLKALLIAFFAINVAVAQVSTYTFTETTETYANITGTNSTATGDNGVQNAIAIGFTFNFGGVNYTTLSLTTNGIIKLGANLQGGSSYNYMYDQNAYRPMIAPFWDDNNRSSGTIRYTTSGNAPYRTFTIAWNAISISDQGNTTGNGSFLVRLKETTNVIEFVYGSMTPDTEGGVIATIGIQDSTSFMSVTPGTTSTTDIATANDNITDISSLSGKKYIFSPANSSDSKLVSLMSSVGTISPTFSSSINDYTVTLPFGTTGSASLTGVAAHPLSTLQNTSAPDVTASNTNNVASIAVTSQNSSSTTTYTVTYSIAAPSTVATLSALSTNVGTLVPTFTPSITDYTVTLPFGSSGAASLTATTTHSGATKVITNATDVNGSNPDNQAKVVVTAQDGTTINTYTVTYSVTAPSTVATLSALSTNIGTLVPTFSPSITDYTVTLPIGSSGTASLTATTTHSGATKAITNATNVNGANPDNQAKVVVTAQDGTTTTTYTVTYSVLTSVKKIENNLNGAFIIQPNPFIDNLTISLDRKITNFNLKVFSILGAEVYSSNFNQELKQIDLNLSDLQPGMYFIQIETKEFKTIKKVNKTK